MELIESIAKAVQNVMNRFLTDVGECPNCDNGKLMIWKSPNREGELRCPPTCPDCGFSERLAKGTTLSDVDATELAAKNAAKDYLYNNSIVSNKEVFKYTFKGFNDSQAERKQAKFFASKMADRIVSGNTVHATLVGGPGRGKTHLAMSICYNVLARTNYKKKVAFVDWRELLDVVKAGMHENSKDVQAYGDNLINEFAKADIVVLDDLGSERGTDYDKDLIDKFWRIREDKTVITTTNLTIRELSDSYSSRMTSRMQKHAKDATFVMTGIDDYRKGR